MYSILPKLMGVLATSVSEIAEQKNSRFNIFITRTLNNEDWELRISSASYVEHLQGWEHDPSDYDNDRWLANDQILNHIVELAVSSVLDTATQEFTQRRYMKHIERIMEDMKEAPLDPSTGTQSVLCLELSNAELALTLDAQMGFYEEGEGLENFDFIVEYSVTAVLNLDPFDYQFEEEADSPNPSKQEPMSLGDLLRKKLPED